MEENSYVFMAKLEVRKHRRAISLLTAAASLTGNIMALYLHFKSTVFAAMRFLYLSLLCEPPRFYVLILLLFLLLIMMVKAGIFDHEEDSLDAEMYDERSGERRSSFDTDVGYYAEAIKRASDMEEEVDIELEMGMKAPMGRHGENEQGKGREGKMDEEENDKCKEPIAIFDDDDEEEEEEEDLEEFHRRVEAFIHKVQMGFFLER